MTRVSVGDRSDEVTDSKKYVRRENSFRKEENVRISTGRAVGARLANLLRKLRICGEI